MAEEFHSEDIKAMREGMRATTERPWLEFPEKLEKAKKMGLDVNKVTLGYVLDHIVGDDVNAFSPLLAGYYQFNPDLSQIGKEMILARMNWEGQFEQLPNESRDRIKNVREKLEAADWGTEEGFRRAYGVWKTEIEEYFEELGKSRQEFNEARTLHRTLEERISKQNLASTPTESFLK